MSKLDINQVGKDAKQQLELEDEMIDTFQDMVALIKKLTNCSDSEAVRLTRSIKNLQNKGILKERKYQEFEVERLITFFNGLDLATKTDVQALKTDVQKDIHKVEIRYLIAIAIIALLVIATTPGGNKAMSYLLQLLHI